MTEFNELIQARGKWVSEKGWRSPKEHEQKLKTWMGNSIGNANDKYTRTSENDKTEEERWNMLGRKEKSATPPKKKQEGTSERRKTKTISRQNKIILTQQEISKQRKKIYQQVGEEYKTTTG